MVIASWVLEQAVIKSLLMFCFQQALVRELSTSRPASFAQAATEVAVEGDVDGVLSSIDKLVSSDAASAKDVADAAVALAYLQAKGNRR